MNTTLAHHVDSVRSKNAGPFWVTIDIFCGTEQAFKFISSQLTNEQVSALMKQPVSQLKRFEIPSLNVIKFSLPRPITQGHFKDRDMHGAQWAVLLQEFPIA